MTLAECKSSECQTGLDRCMKTSFELIHKGKQLSSWLMQCASSDEACKEEETGCKQVRMLLNRKGLHDDTFGGCHVECSKTNDFTADALHFNPGFTIIMSISLGLKIVLFM